MQRGAATDGAVHQQQVFCAGHGEIVVEAVERDVELAGLFIQHPGASGAVVWRALPQIPFCKSS